jgi:predicted GNAT family acetyltransferase
MTEFKHFKNGTKGHFSAYVGDKEAGKISYFYIGENRIIIDHTEVNNSYHGLNIGKKLVMQIVEFARENKLIVLPLCPFAKSVFERTKEIRDVLQ